MGQRVSSCCPCLSSEYTEIHDDCAAPLVDGQAQAKHTHTVPAHTQAQEGKSPYASGSTAGREGGAALLAALSSAPSSGSSTNNNSNNSSNSSNSSSNNNNNNNNNNSSNSGYGSAATTGVPSQGRASLSLPLSLPLRASTTTTTNAIEFDLQSPVFRGSVVQQKFFNKSSYEAKFAWINLKSRALCLSEHMTKERRHKEASIADVTGVICGPPEKFKAAVVGPQGELQSCDPDLCLSVKFVRGGGIDLKFSSMHERDEWADVLLRMIQALKKHEVPGEASRQ